MQILFMFQYKFNFINVHINYQKIPKLPKVVKENLINNTIIEKKEY